VKHGKKISQGAKSLKQNRENGEGPIKIPKGDSKRINTKASAAWVITEKFSIRKKGSREQKKYE